MRNAKRDLSVLGCWIYGVGLIQRLCTCDKMLSAEILAGVGATGMY